MRKFFVLSIILLISSVVSVPLVSAQTLSSGCATFASQSTDTPTDFATVTFFAGEILTFEFTGTGDFSVLSNGGTVGSGFEDGDIFILPIAVEGSYAISIDVTGGDGTTLVVIACSNSDDDDDDDGDGITNTLCHRPPGNPAAAHTITVGSDNAVAAHLRHGDSLGPCPPGVQTRSDNISLGIVIFVIYQTDTIQVYGDCLDDECDEVLSVPITDLIDFNLVIVNGEYIEVENPEDYEFMVDEPDDNGMYAVIYYLHPDPEDPTVGVFQINVYNNGVLSDDNILVFINFEGSIIFWSDQGFWADQLDDDDV